MTSTIRVLHAVGGMNRGGTETWLLNTLRFSDKRHFDFTFLKSTTSEHAYDKELLSLGGSIAVCEGPRRLHAFVPAFAKLLRSERFDIVHSHLHFFSGVILAVAAACRVGVRIAHAHTDTRLAQTQRSLQRRGYRAMMQQATRVSMTHGLAVSDGAAKDLFGRSYAADKRVQLFSCGIDLAPYQSTNDRTQIRASLGIPHDAQVIGHVGRLEPPKNHAFLVDVAQRVMQRNPRVFLLLIGDGALRAALERKVAAMGIEHRTRFVGSVGNVPELLLGAVDAFVFPSLWEGLGLAVVEAQAAGLRCVVSSEVPASAVVNAESVERLSLAAPLEVWETAVVRALQVPLQRDAGLALVRSSPFNISESSRALFKLYQTAKERSAGSTAGDFHDC